MKPLLPKIKEALNNLAPNDPPRIIITEIAKHYFKIEEVIKKTNQDQSIPSVDNADILTKCKFLQTEFFPHISEIIEQAISQGFENFFETEDAETLYNRIEENVIAFIIKSENLETIKAKFNPSNNNKTIQEMIEEIGYYLVHNSLHPLIIKQLKKKATGQMVQETDEEGFTLLHLVCQKGNLRLLQNLVERGWSTEKIGDIDPKEIAKSNGYSDIVEYLENLKPAPVRYKGSFGMIALMGAATSPAKKIIISQNGFSVEAGTFPETVQQAIRPATIQMIGNRVAITPGGSQTFPTWDITIDIDKPPTERKIITVFLDQKKSDKRIAQAVKKSKELPASIPTNTKLQQEVIIAHITKERIQRWETIIAASNQRYRDQNTTMKKGAGVIARTAGFAVFNDNNWQWCHIIAYSLGGIDGIFPENPAAYDYQGPQQEKNLVIGTTEANAHMLVVEHVVKNLILRKEIPELYIKVKPTFVVGLEHYHIAETLEYTIQDREINPQHQITFSFEMLSQRKTALQEPSIIGPIIENLFLNKGAELISTPTPTSAIISTFSSSSAVFSQSSIVPKIKSLHTEEGFFTPIAKRSQSITSPLYTSAETPKSPTNANDSDHEGSQDSPSNKSPHQSPRK